MINQLLAYLDWSFDQDVQNIYRFVVVRDAHGFKEGERVLLTIDGTKASQYGKILKVEDDGIVVKTDEWLDISEVYSIKGVDA